MSANTSSATPAGPSPPLALSLSKGLRTSRRHAFDREQVLDPGRRRAQRPIPLFRYDERSRLARLSVVRGVVVVVRMKLPLKLRQALLELGLLNRQLPRQTEEREVVAVTAKRQDAAALRAEVLVHRSPSAAAAALERRNGAHGNRVASHRMLSAAIVGAVRRSLGEGGRVTRRRSCRKPQVCFAFGCGTRSPVSEAQVS